MEQWRWRAVGLGLAVVDELVFALAEQDPGFAKLYFLLEQELLRPKYELHGFGCPICSGGSSASDPALRAAQEDAARASLALRRRSKSTSACRPTPRAGGAARARAAARALAA